MRPLIALVLLVLACDDEQFPTRPPAQAPPPVRLYREVKVRDNFFNPVPLTITVGTRVFFTNDGFDNHAIVFDAPVVFHSGWLSPGQQVQRQFNAIGVFTYRCEIHPKMRGTIAVQAAPPRPEPLQ